MAASLNRILYAEDEPDISQVAKLALETVGGFQVEVYSNGRLALEAVPRVKPDLILLDVMMPEMDGPSTLKALRETPGIKDIPVIFMTAKVQPSEIQGYKDLGAIDVISKPFDPMSLSDRINEIWSKNFA